MKELQRVHDKTSILFGIEPIGHYWFPLVTFLEEAGIQMGTMRNLYRIAVQL